MKVRDEALFIIGVYQAVLDEILVVQDHLPTQTMFLQPYKGQRIVHLDKKRPSTEDRVQLLISTTDELDEVRYCAEIVAWDDKRKLKERDRDGRRRTIERLLWSLQPREGGLYDAAQGDQPSVNLLHVWNLRPVKERFSATELINTKDGANYKGGRSTAGGWLYVQRVADEKVGAPRRS